MPDSKKARFTATTLELGSLGCITAGAFTLTPWLGLIVLGLCLGVIGYALDPDRGGNK